jgi:ribosomal protein S18 acetylase RimI-like enzyme
VAPGHQRRGIGAALVSEGLRDLAERRGAEVGMLYVDADNTAGNALYGQIGFRLDHVDRALVKRLESGAEPPPA